MSIFWPRPAVEEAVTPPPPPDDTGGESEPYNEIELDFIDESPILFPSNHSSYWGTHRKVFTDELQTILDQQSVLWLNRLVTSASEYLDLWEEELAIPLSTQKTAEARRAVILSRLRKSPFTRTRRREVVEAFVSATFGEAPQFSPAGLELNASGIPLRSDPGVVTDFYSITENITNFSYSVGIARSLGADLVSLQRELEYMTPAGISLAVTQDYFETSGATSAASGGFTIDRTDL